MFAGPAGAAAAGAGVAATAGAASPPAGAAGGAPAGGGAALSCANARPEPRVANASPKAEQTIKRTVRFVIFLLRLTSRTAANSYKPRARYDAWGGPRARLLGQFGFESQFVAVTMRQRMTGVPPHGGRKCALL